MKFGALEKASGSAECQVSFRFSAIIYFEILAAQLLNFLRHPSQHTIRQTQQNFRFNCFVQTDHLSIV